MSNYRPNPGDKVGAQRWPYFGNHPDCWGKPWSGTVLAINDKRAWRSILGQSGEFSQEQIDRHIQECRKHWPDWHDKHVPVLWDFGGEAVVYWERIGDGGVQPYADDLALWQQARWSAMQQLRKAA